MAFNDHLKRKRIPTGIRNIVYGQVSDLLPAGTDLAGGSGIMTRMVYLTEAPHAEQDPRWHPCGDR